MKYKLENKYAWLLQPPQAYYGSANDAFSYVYTITASLLILVTACGGFVTPLFLKRALI